MKQKTHAIIALMSVILYFIFIIIYYFIFIIIYYLICNIFSLQGGDDFVLFIWLSIIDIPIALFSITYSLLFYYKFKHFPINNYVYTLYLILIVGSLIYIWHGWII